MPGRREFAQYFDLGVEEASHGLVSSQVTRLRNGMAEETGWHYHDCDFQWLYVVKGWLELQFENGETKRVHEDGICFIPGGYRHNETATSDDLEFVEIFMPPNPDTVPVDSPL
ncbi:cupin domain-containing protein [Aeromicrobium sp. CTD01-1L150]|uniref:cupin domain-containing protein n=1 Tax=Aeromicrobium sp. CTD01-1L150 TaxID=3341830 RepID=UPI0035C138E3